MTERATHITWHHGHVGDETRRRLFGHGAAAVWLTGLSGSGKSTVARALEAALVARGVHAYVLDGDNLRHGLNADLGFGDAAREENVRRAGQVTRLMADAGLVVITAFISPFRASRQVAREAVAPVAPFFEVHVATPLEVCESRDPKGLYAKARSGAIPSFTGIDSPYEAPLAPELVIGADGSSIEEQVAALVALLVARGVIAAT